MEYGLDARFPALHGARSDLPRFHHNSITFPSCMPSASISSRPEPRRSGVRKGLAFREMPGDECESLRISALFYAWMYGLPGEAALQGQEFGSAANGIMTAAWIGSARVRSRWPAPTREHLNYTYKSEPALWDLDDITKALSGSIHDATTAWWPSCGDHKQGRDRLCGQRHAAGFARLSARRPAPVSIARSSTPTARPMAEATSATWAVSRPTRPNGRAGRIP